MDPYTVEDATYQSNKHNVMMWGDLKWHDENYMYNSYILVPPSTRNACEYITDILKWIGGELQVQKKFHIGYYNHCAVFVFVIWMLPTRKKKVPFFTK